MSNLPQLIPAQLVKRHLHLQELEPLDICMILALVTGIVLVPIQGLWAYQLERQRKLLKLKPLDIKGKVQYRRLQVRLVSLTGFLTTILACVVCWMCGRIPVEFSPIVPILRVVMMIYVVLYIFLAVSTVVQAITAVNVGEEVLLDNGEVKCLILAAPQCTSVKSTVS